VVEIDVHERRLRQRQAKQGFDKITKPLSELHIYQHVYFQHLEEDK